jgi:hypothetical protein
MMTEAQWLACTDPAPMLEFLSGKASERKLRLFACACCRRVWDSWQPNDLHPALLTCEAFADGLVGRRALRIAHTVIGGVGSYSAKASVYSATSAALHAVASTAADWTAKHAAEYFALVAVSDYITPANREAFLTARDLEYKVQAGLFRDIFGNTFRPVAIDPAWLRWNHGTVPAVARRVFEDRAFHDLPILADALEDAGCADAAVLAHCRSGGEHVRGCWAVDLILGKS